MLRVVCVQWWVSPWRLGRCQQGGCQQGDAGARAAGGSRYLDAGARLK